MAVASCGQAEKFRYPVVVTADKAAIYAQPDTSADTRIMFAKRGDTLDLKAGAVNGLYTVAPKPGASFFPSTVPKALLTRSICRFRIPLFVLPKTPLFLEVAKQRRKNKQQTALTDTYQVERQPLQATLY
ncbi:hypothetical protein MUN86_11465 [Hymenobacter volaticus]|uniref:Uncharacterized protein n=1 Tax=Hymenobacter volaticus TaxID=2932254 RepID=A0ABY4GC42_9BACT|nr:hypothetical protein MUN86_11465 [Hymenobacter volaticus]